MIAPYHSFELEGEQLHLYPDRCAFWPAQSALLLADLHIGKTNHFRKNGFAVPQMAGRNNLWRLGGLMEACKAQHIIFLGDLFHSVGNQAWPEFVDFLDAYPQVRRTLITGNHDILGAAVFAEAGLEMHTELEMGPLLLSHDRVEHPSLFNLHGHIHPGVRLRGSAKQTLTLPCFYFDMKQRYGVLPSFGDFTGLHKMKVNSNHRIFVCAGSEVLQVA